MTVTDPSIRLLQFSDIPLNWKSEPMFRGTFNILSTCIGTLTICVWSAVHIDILTRRSSLTSFLKKFGWMIVGIFAPEALLLTAYHQHLVAKSTLKYARERLVLPGVPHARYQKWFKSAYSLVSLEETEVCAQSSRIPHYRSLI